MTAPVIPGNNWMSNMMFVFYGIILQTSSDVSKLRLLLAVLPCEGPGTLTVRCSKLVLQTFALQKTCYVTMSGEL